MVADARFRPLGISQRYRPAQRGPGRISQIQISPEINAPINLSLGSLPIVIGSFAGSIVMFVLGSQVKALKPVTTIGGIGLAGFGIFNLLAGEASAAVPGGDELPGSVSPASGASSNVSPSIAPTAEAAFPLINARVIGPTDFQTVEQSPFDSMVPVRLRVSNPSNVAVTFDMIFEVNEIPAPFGAEVINEESTRVSLGIGETRDIDVPITLTAWGWSTDTVDVYLTVRKRRISGGSRDLLAAVHFVVD